MLAPVVGLMLNVTNYRQSITFFATSERIIIIFDCFAFVVSNRSFNMRNQVSGSKPEKLILAVRAAEIFSASFNRFRSIKVPFSFMLLSGTSVLLQ